MESVDEKLIPLEQFAKQYYDTDGPNQWPHIQRVKRQAERLAMFRKQGLTKEELAAIYFHDIGKREAGNMDHGEYAAKITRPLLRDYLTPAQIETVITAIKAHNFDKPSPNSTAELLRAADANIPNIAWFLRKSYYKMRDKGYSHEEALRNAKNGAKKHIMTAAQLKYRPKIYEQTFAQDIYNAEKEADNLSLKDVETLIKQYNEAHPTESKYT